MLTLPSYSGFLRCCACWVATLPWPRHRVGTRAWTAERICDPKSVRLNLFCHTGLAGFLQPQLLFSLTGNCASMEPALPCLSLGPRATCQSPKGSRKPPCRTGTALASSSPVALGKLLSSALPVSWPVGGKEKNSKYHLPCSASPVSSPPLITAPRSHVNTKVIDIVLEWPAVHSLPTDTEARDYKLFCFLRCLLPSLNLLQEAKASPVTLSST